MRDNHFGYTIRHRRAFREVEKQLLGRNTLKGYFHDLDKLFLYIFMDYHKAHKVHKLYARHHINNARTHDDLVQVVIDWECARLTKPKVKFTAREHLYQDYPEYIDILDPVLQELHL